MGLSNLISGLTGGYTGSYIFCQTIFTLRTCPSRAVGVVVLVCEVLLFVVPIPLLSVIPAFVFGATLVFIAFDLMLEWIVEAWHRVAVCEYVILLLTFISMVLTSNLQFGIALGITNISLFVPYFVPHFVLHSAPGASFTASRHLVPTLGITNASLSVPHLLPASSDACSTQCLVTHLSHVLTHHLVPHSPPHCLICLTACFSISNASPVPHACFAVQVSPRQCSISWWSTPDKAPPQLQLQ